MVLSSWKDLLTVDALVTTGEGERSMQRQRYAGNDCQDLDKTVCDRIGLCPEDEWSAIYFAGFLLMLCRSIQTFTPRTSLKEMALSPRPYDDGGGGGMYCMWQVAHY